MATSTKMLLGKRRLVSIKTMTHYITNTVLFIVFLATTNCQATQTISIVDLYPWGYIDNGPQGIHNEIIKLLNARLDHTIAIEIKPYARVENELKTGKIPFTFLAGGALGREQDVIAGPVFLDLKFGIIVRKNSKFKQLSDLNNSIIAVMNGLKISKCFKFNTNIQETVKDCHPKLQTFKRIPIKNYHQGLKMLNANRIDGVVGSIPTIHQMLNRIQNTKPWPHVSLDSKIFILKTVPVSIVYSKKHYDPNLAQAINKELITIRDLGLIQKIYYQFLETK